MIVCSVAAAAQSPMYVDVSQCRDIKVDLVRVACYDTLADQVQGQIPPAVTGNAPGQNQEQDDINRQLQEQNWRMREQLARQRQAESGGQVENDRTAAYDNYGLRVEEEDGKKILYDRISGLHRIPDGWIITLANGQVWRQNGGRSYRLSVGQDVKIEPALWGDSYRLSVAELGSFIRVERIK